MWGILPKYLLEPAENYLLPSFLSFSEENENIIEITSIISSTFESLSEKVFTANANVKYLPDEPVYYGVCGVNNKRNSCEWEDELDTEFGLNAFPQYIRTFSIGSEERFEQDIEIINECNVTSIFSKNNNVNIPTVKQCYNDDEEILQILLAVA
jgi:hypothetical protein